MLAFLGALALVVCSALAPAQVSARGACAGEDAPVSGSSPSALRASVLCLVNVTRLEHGLPALHRDLRLEFAAQQHSDDMVNQHYFAHDSLDGTTPFQRITASGYTWAQAGENIAQGQGTPAAVVEGWLDELNSSSNGHCMSILEPGFRDLGVGANSGRANPAFAAGTWTQDFGRLRGDPAASTNTGPQGGCPYNLSAISAGPLPTASTPTASAITQTSAMLNGSVSANGGGFTSYHVEYGTTAGYGTQTLERGAGTSGTVVTEPLSGLARGTTYHFRVAAMNQNGEADSPDATFSTLPGASPPTASTTAATSVAQTSASLSGTVNPNGLATSYHFEYGTTTSYGSTSATVSAGAGTTADPVSAGLSGLSPGTTYHYRLVANNADGTSLGADVTVTTGKPSPTQPVEVPRQPVAVIDVTAPTAVLSGSRSQRLGKTVRVSVSCTDEACLAGASGTVRVPRVGPKKSKVYKLKKVTAGIAKGGRAKLSPRLSSAARKAIKRALRRGRRITVKLKITVADAAGNTRTLTRKVKLRR